MWNSYYYDNRKRLASQLKTANDKPRIRAFVSAPPLSNESKKTDAKNIKPRFPARSEIFAILFSFMA